MKKILLLIFVVFLSGCSLKLRKVDINTNLINKDKEIAEEIVSDNPSIQYCYKYNDFKFLCRLVDAMQKAIKVVGEEYPDVMDYWQADEYVKTVSLVTVAIYSKENVKDLDFSGLSKEQRKECEKLKRSSNILSNL